MSSVESRKYDEKLERAHTIALHVSRQAPNRSDPFSYRRVFSRVVNGLMEEKDMKPGPFGVAIV